MKRVHEVTSTVAAKSAVADGRAVTARAKERANDLVPSTAQLDAAEATALRNLGSRVTGDPVDHPDWYCRQARRLSHELPDSLTTRMRDFAKNGSDMGVLVIQGVDVGKVPPTPLSNVHAVGARTELASQVAVLSHVLGEMVSYQAEGCGYLIQDMVPNPRLAKAQQSQGSTIPLEAHTEQCFSDFRPDFVVLSSLRGDPDAHTYTFTARKLMNRLSESEVELLHQPLWTTRIDSSFAAYVPHPEEIRGPFAILTGNDGDPHMLVDQDLMSGTTSESQELLEKVIRIYDEFKDSYTLQPGDVLFLDNYRAMHGRSAFTPRFDGTDRFILRGFVARELTATASARNPHSRQILAQYS